jgi:hypothetical protein
MPSDITESDGAGLNRAKRRAEASRRRRGERPKPTTAGPRDMLPPERVPQSSPDVASTDNALFLLPDATGPPDRFVADPEVARELSVSLMTLWRYDNSPELRAMGWPLKVQIGKRNFRSRRALEAFKSNMLRKALAERKRLVTEAATA